MIFLGGGGRKYSSKKKPQGFRILAIDDTGIIIFLETLLRTCCGSLKSDSDFKMTTGVIILEVNQGDCFPNGYCPLRTFYQGLFNFYVFVHLVLLLILLFARFL